jgi:ribosomal protein S17E
MNEPEHDLNLQRMREALLKLEVTQFAKAETQMAKLEIREHVKEQIHQEVATFREEIRRERDDVRRERRSFYTRVALVATFLIGSDIWTMTGLYQHAKQVLQDEVEKNRRTVAEVLTAETKKIQDQVQSVKTSLDQAQTVASEAQTKALSASKLADSSIVKITEEGTTLNTQVDAVQKQLSGALQTRTQLDAVQKEVSSTSAALKVQQKQLADTSEMVKMLFSKSITEQFVTTANTDQIVIWPSPAPSSQRQNGALVFLRLQEAPIPQTLQVQFNIYVQPKMSYGVLNGFPNVVYFNWGDPAENLKPFPLAVTYIPDKSLASSLVKALSIKGNTVYADGKPLISIPPPAGDAPKK